MQLEKIFAVMRCTDAQKVVFAAYMLEGEVKHWWRDAKSLLESKEIEITLKVFLATFFDKYFLDSLRKTKKLSLYSLSREE